MELYLLIAGLVFNVVVTVIVLADNPKKNSNRLVALSAFALFFWELSNYLADKSKLYTIFWNRATFIGPIFILIFAELFVVYLIGRKPKLKVYLPIFLLSFFMSLISLTSLLIPKIYPSITNGKIVGYNPTFGPAYYLIISWTLLLALRLIWRIYKSRKEAHGKSRNQLNVIAIGASSAIIMSIITNLVLPDVTGSTSITKYAPLASVLFMGSIVYAIVQHGLFDIRLLIARTLGYLFSLVSVSIVFILLAYVLIDKIIPNLSSSYLKFIYLLFAVVLAIIFPFFKKYYDKLTNRVFFRDSYDVQVFLDQFNKILVSTFELNLMLTKISDLIELNIKPVYCLFVIKETNNNSRRFIGTKNYLKFHNNNIDIVNNVTKRLHSKIIATDLLEDKYSDDRRLLLKHNISIINKLASSNSAESVGYLVLGPKKSGNMYSSQDIKILEIIANELVVAIQNALHTEDIENFNLTLQEKIKEATHRLRTTNEKLRALDEAKDDFVSMASHQLRTPLTSVKGNISLVLDGDAGKISSLQKQLLEQAFASSQRMVYLIADLLNVSRLKTGKFIIEKSAVDLASVIEEEVKQLVETAKSRNLELNYQKPDKITHLMLDETKTRQVIMNFVDNAIYYTPSGGRIDVILSENNNDVECRVVDNGIGVPKSEQPHLFTKFYRAANARKARPDGTGLGLFMAKKVIIAEGGAIIFDTQEGKGSTFGFSFPKAALAVKTSSVQNQPQEQAAVAV